MAPARTKTSPLPRWMRSGVSRSRVRPCICRPTIPGLPTAWPTEGPQGLDMRRPLDFLQLLQAANDRRHRRIRKAGLPVGDADFAEIDVALRIQRDAVRCEEFAGLEARTILAAEPRDALSLGVDDGQAGAQIWRLQVDRHARTQLADNEIRLPAAAAMQRAGPVQIIPLRLEFAVAVEHLHAVVLAVRHIDPAVLVGDDVVDDVELARIGAGLAPGLYQPAVRRVFVDAGVAVAVRHVDFALRRQRRVGAAVERLAAHERWRLVWDADRPQHLALHRAFARRMIAVIGAIEIVVGIDVQPMRAAEQPFAPAGDEIALAVEHDHRVRAAIEGVDAVLAVNRDGRDIGEIPAVGELGPVFHHTVAMLARAENGRHVFSPPDIAAVIPGWSARTRPGISRFRASASR